MPERLPKIEADALRECWRILARHYPVEHQVFAWRIELLIQEGQWPMFDAFEVAHLFYPYDDTKAAAFHGKLKAAIAARELHSAFDEKLSPTSLCGWRSCDPVPADSPLCYVLPESMHEKANAGDKAPKKGRKQASATVSRPGERQAYFRTLWLELDTPLRNQGIWTAMHRRQGGKDASVVSVAGQTEFVFRYADKSTERLDKTIFQKDMSAVRRKG